MLTIGQVASRAGLRASAIRYYESRGLLPAASRQGGKRVYDATILERLGAIELAKAAGFGLDEIRALMSRAGSGRPGPIWNELGRAKHAELERQIAGLVRKKAVVALISGCSCATLDHCGRAFTAALSKYPVAQRMGLGRPLRSASKPQPPRD